MKLSSFSIFLIITIVLAAIATIIVLPGCQTNPTAAGAATLTSTTQPATPATPPTSSSAPASDRSYYPTPTPTYNPPQVMADVITAMGNLNYVVLKSNVVNSYSWKGRSEHGFNTIVWNGDSSIDYINHKLHLKLNIDQNNTLNSGQSGYIGTSNDVYFDKDYRYQIKWPFATGNYPGSNVPIAWSKKNLPPGDWTANTPLFSILELLKNADQSTMSFANDKIDGQDYRTISFSPSPSSIADWVISQGNFAGPILTTALRPALIGKDIFVKSFQGGIFQLWIDNNNRIYKAYFAVNFSATLDESNIPNQPEYQDHQSDFFGQMSFSNYNQPPNIQVPAEALNATLIP